MPQHQVQSPTEDEQTKFLDEALSNIKLQSFHMRCCLDKGKWMEALKHASSMLAELRTSTLSPRSYYELFMAVTDQLRHLELYLVEEFKADNKIYELYELVQYAGNIIPRLYLLVSVGFVYMKANAGCRKEILRDLVEMCRGVQHPLRGLFLRNYLLQTCRHVLPDTLTQNGSLPETKVATVSAVSKPAENLDEAESELKAEKSQETVGQAMMSPPPMSSIGGDDAGTVMDSIEFVLTNFAEMNKLWVRMQHLGHTREKEKREKERLELRLLVGTNLVRLSQLESIDVHLYNRVVLPGILEQVVSCKDAIAQEYLMESLIQVFPDDFHLETLEPFLNSCAQLAPEVKVKNIIIALVDRLAASSTVQLPDDLFETFSRQISNIIENRESISIEDIIIMQGSLINFSMKKIHDEEKRERSIDSVLEATLKAIKAMNVATISLRSNLGKEMFRFLKLPFNLAASSTSIDGSGAPANEFSLIKMSLKLKHFKDLLIETSDIELHQQFILSLMNATLENHNEDNIKPSDRLSLIEIETFLTELCAPLVNGTNKVLLANGHDSKTGAVVINDQDEDFIDEQLILSRFLHFLLLPQCIETDEEGGSESGEGAESTQLLDITYLTLNSTRKILATGGPSRVRFTYPSLVFEALQLSSRYTKTKSVDEKWEKKVQKIYQYVNQIIVALLKESNCPELCLRLFLESALNSAKSGISDRESISYEFISQAFAIYEEEISASKEQTLCLMLIISTVKNVKFESIDNFIPLRNQCCLNCGKLVKKSDQCRAILSASALFINEAESTIEAEVVKCFRKCIKLCSALLDASAQLQMYVEILSYLTLYVNYKNDEVNQLTKSLVELIDEKKAETPMSELTAKQHANTIKFYEKCGLLESNYISISE